MIFIFVGMSNFFCFVPMWSLRMLFSNLEFNFTSGHFSQSSVPSFETSHLTSLAIQLIVQTFILWQCQEEKIFSFLSLLVMNLLLPKLFVQCSIQYVHALPFLSVLSIEKPLSLLDLCFFCYIFLM